MSRRRTGNCISTTDSCMRSGSGACRNTSRLGPSSASPLASTRAADLRGDQVRVFGQADAHAQRHDCPPPRQVAQLEIKALFGSSPSSVLDGEAELRVELASFRTAARAPPPSAMATACARQQPPRDCARNTPINPRALDDDSTLPPHRQQPARAGSARSITSSDDSEPSLSICAMRVSMRRRRLRLPVPAPARRRCGAQQQATQLVGVAGGALSMSPICSRLEAELLQDRDPVRARELQPPCSGVSGLRVGMRGREQTDFVVEAQQPRHTRAMREKSPILGLASWLCAVSRAPR